MAIGDPLPKIYWLPERDGIKLGQLVMVRKSKSKRIPCQQETGSVVKISASNIHPAICVEFTPEVIKRHFPDGPLPGNIVWFFASELQLVEQQEEEPWE